MRMKHASRDRNARSSRSPSLSPARDAKPQHVHRRAEIDDLQPRRLAQGRMAPVGGDDKVGADRQRPVRPLRVDPDDLARLFDQRSGLGAHQKPEGVQRGGLGGEEIQEIPLRHHRDIIAGRRQAREIADRGARLAEHALHAIDLLVRQAQELVEKSQFLHDVERRGMDRVAAKVAQEIGVLLEHHDVDAGARQQKSQHHPRRPAAGDAATCGNRRIAQGRLPIAGAPRELVRLENIQKSRTIEPTSRNPPNAVTSISLRASSCRLHLQPP